MPSTAAAVPGDPVTPDTVRALAALAGIALPEADVAPVALLLAGQAATVAPPYTQPRPAASLPVTKMRLPTSLARSTFRLQASDR